MPEIIRFDERDIDGYFYRRYVYGLTIFHINRVQDTEDAMITFFRALVATYPCAAQVGFMAIDWADNPHELFAPLQEGKDYFSTHINSYAHGGIWTEEKAAGFFFPHLTEAFFELTNDEGEPLIDDLLMYDQPFLYINVGDMALTQFTELYAHPPVMDDGQEYWKYWWKAVTDISPIGMCGGYDDSIMTVFSRDPAYFRLLDRPLKLVDDAIRATPWFQAHQHELRWPEEDEQINDWCLMLPDYIEREKVKEAHRQERLRKAN